MIKRRTDERLTATKLIDEVTYSSLDWPGKTVRLERDSLSSYCQRSASHQPSIAELYHENSKIYGAMANELAANRVDVQAVRAEFLKRRHAQLSALPTTQLDWAPLLDQVRRTASRELFYALELRILTGDSMLVFNPLSGDLHKAKHFKSQGPSIRRMVIVASFARNDILFGPRGYRRTLIEAGQLIAAILEITGGSCRLEFEDRALDRMIEADGVEESAIAVIDLE